MSNVLYKNIEIENFKPNNKGEFLIKSSSEIVDFDNEIVLQSGITANYPLNYLLEHRDENIIGSITKGYTQKENDINGYYNFGELFLNGKGATIALNDLNIIYNLMKKGVGQNSIGFVSLESHINEKGQKVHTKILLREISYTLNPANIDTGVLEIKNNDIELKECIKKYTEFNKKYAILSEVRKEISRLSNCEKTSQAVECVKSIFKLARETELSNVITKSFIGSIKNIERKNASKYSVQEEYMDEEVKKNTLEKGENESLKKEDKRASLIQALHLKNTLEREKK